MSNERSKSADAAPVVDGAESSSARTPEAEPLILCVDTATAARSVAVQRGGRLLALVGEDAPQGAHHTHAANVLADIDEALRRAAVSLREVELFGVAAGPGSFTGLRAGLATIKSFAATLGRPTVGVPTLHAIAHAARPAKRCAALIPAGRGEVFAQLLSIDAEGCLSELEAPAHANPEALVERLREAGESLLWAGAGAHLWAAQIEAGARAAGYDFAAAGVGNSAAEGAGEAAGRGVVWTLARPVEILAAHVAALTLRSFRAGLCARAADLQAIYVRASDAELNERWRSQQSPRKEIQSDTPSAR